MSLNDLEKNFNKKNNDNITTNSDDINNYKIDKKIGEGRFSKVYLAYHKLTSEKVAIKIIFKNKNKSPDFLDRIKSEIEILKKVKHNNISKLFSVIETEERIYLIQELIDGHDLLYFINLKEKPEIKLKQICYYFRQIISAVNYLHNVLNISHRDLKPENILINEKNEIKLIDFGLGKIYKYKNKIIKLKTHCGSPFYAAPEMIKGGKYYGNISDIWSLGVILYFMIFGELPFYDSDLTRLYKKILEGKYIIPKEKINLVGKDAVDLIKKMLEKEPDKRIKINKIMEHNWFKRENNDLFIGFNINEIVMPFDEDILEEINNKYGFNKEKIKISILKNIYDNGRSLYLILLDKKIKNGEKSIADLKCDLYVNYINNENNKLKYYGNNIENVIKERVKSYENSKISLNKYEEKNNYNNSENELSLSKKNEIQVKEFQNKFVNNKNKSQNNIYESKNIKMILKKASSHNKNAHNKPIIKNIIKNEIIKNELHIIEKKKLIDKKHENFNNKHKLNFIPGKLIKNSNGNKTIKVKKKFDIKDISKKNNKIDKNEKKYKQKGKYFNSEINIQIHNHNNSQKNIKLLYKTNNISKSQKSSEASLMNKSQKILTKFESLKKENKIFETQSHIRNDNPLTLYTHRSADLSKNNYKTKEFSFYINNNLINRNDFYLNKTIKSELIQHKVNKLKNLILNNAHNSINNDLKNIKKNFLKQKEKIYIKEENRKEHILTNLNARTEYNNHSVIMINKKIPQKEKNLKIFSPEHNFKKNKIVNKRKINNNQIKSSKNLKSKTNKTLNNSINNQIKHSYLAIEISNNNKFSPKKKANKKRKNSNIN